MKVRDVSWHHANWMIAATAGRSSIWRYPDALLDVLLTRAGDAGVALLAQGSADRRRDVSLGEHARRHLVEQRLEEVMVRAVDDRHVHWGNA
jgi:hypothetical protein